MSDGPMETMTAAQQRRRRDGDDLECIASSQPTIFPTGG